MIFIYPEQLSSQLPNQIKTCYLIFGNDFFLLQECVDKICKIAKQKDFTERYAYSLDVNTDWKTIYFISRSFSLFSCRQILILTLPENGPNIIMAKNLFKLVELLHSDLLLILCGNKLSKVQKNSNWYKKISKNGVYINCLTPSQTKLPQWVTQRTKAMSLTLEKQANQLLCYCYEGNLTALNQALERLSILYPDGNLTLSRIKDTVHNFVNFTPYHWIDALLLGEIKRSWHILQQLQYENYEAMILLHIVQRELILLLTLKQQNSDKNLKKLFDQHKVLQSRRQLIRVALERLSLRKLQLAVQLITRIELDLKQNYNQLIFPKLEILSMLLCNKLLYENFIDDSKN
ncbi:MAG: DNA polymerase III subunit delta [Arsenophonus sp. ET-DL9-MAG3]